MRTQPVTASQVAAISKVSRRSALADVIRNGRTTANTTSATISQSIIRIGRHSVIWSLLGFEV